MRGGKMEVKKSEELVPGDIVIREAGDAVPADGRILESASMKIEEAALTGESVPVNKTADPLNTGTGSEISLGDRKNMVYMGSTVVYGRGRAVITGTGMETEMGKIAHVLTQSADETTPLQKRLNQLSKILSVMVLGILDACRKAVTGAELDELSDEELDRKIEEYAVYARVQPEHKVRIVDAWKRKGKITAMTGDGVNDAPSIKRADIGIGMGITGTDVTKNVADMVLADDNFATIIAAVEEGRRIYDNIRKAIQFLLASNLAEVLSIFCATLMGFTILNPVHLLWINLITDCFPALALGMEDGEADIMKRPPRNADDGIFADGLGFDVAFQGIVITVLTLASYFIGHYLEAGRWEIVNSPDGMSMAFLTLSMVEIFHSFNMRSRKGSIFHMKHQNKYLWGAMALSFVLTSAVIYIPVLSNAFGFEHISALEYDVAIGLGLLIIPAVEISKWIRRKFA